MSRVHTRTIGMLAMVALNACHREPDTIAAPLMISEGVVVSERFEAAEDGGEARSEVVGDAPADERVIVTGTLVMRGTPARLFQTWKMLSLRPTPRSWTPPHGSAIGNPNVAVLPARLLPPVQITDEIACCFLAWRTIAPEECVPLDGEVWFHECSRDGAAPPFTDVHLTLVCEGRPTASCAEQQALRLSVEERVQRQLHEFRQLVNG